MTGPVFSLPVPQAGQTTKQLLDAEMKRVISALYATIAAGAEQEAIDSLVAQIDAIRAAAEDATDDAIVAKDEAEAARDATQLAALSTGYQPDIATAEAALANGDVFFLIDGDDAVYYQIASGSAVAIEGLRVPLSAAFLREVAARFSLIREGGNLGQHSVTDPDGYAASVTDDEGVSNIRGVQVGPVRRVQSDGAGGVYYRQIDEAGFTSAQLTDEGFAIAGVAAQAEGAAQLSTTNRLPHRPTAQMIAHRGVHMGGQIAPENSLDALYLAARAGFRFCEIDFAATSDDELVMLHDSTLARTLRNAADYSAISPDVAIDSITLATLRADYVMAASTLRYRRPVPTVEEAFIACKRLGLVPFIELKNTLVITHWNAITALAVEIFGEDGCIISSFNASALNHIRTIQPNIRLCYHPPFGIDPPTEAFIANAAAKAPALVAPRWDSLSSAVVAEIKAAGLQCVAYTVPPSSEAALIEMGVDMMMTDFGSCPPDTAQIITSISDDDGLFTSVDHTGTVADGVLTLAAGQSIIWEPLDIALPYGTMQAQIEYDGEFTATGTLTGTVGPSSDISGWSQTKLLAQDTPNFIVTAGAGGCVIHSLSAIIAKY